MPKYQKIRDALLASIRSGEFPPDSRLPAERELAIRFGVSYVTARRAVEELAKAKLLERRPRSGTFVLPDSLRTLSGNALNLILPTGDSALTRAFLRIVVGLVEAQGWEPRITRISAGDEKSAARIIESGIPVFFQSTGLERQEPLLSALRRSNGRAILMFNRMDDLGVSSVLADDSHGLRLAVHHLQENGHRDIALLCDQPTHPVAHLQIAAWRTFCARTADADVLPQRLIRVQGQNVNDVALNTYNAVREFLRTPDGAAVSALISLSEEMTLAAVAACRDEGRPVPEGMSIVTSGDNTALAFADPPITWVDVNLEEHIVQALSLLKAADQETLDPIDRLRLIEPRLIQRQSVAPCRER
jgi:DNA-binding LacI/PurR family transcriptional regulator